MERTMSVEDRIRRAEERYYNTRTIDVLQEKESRDSSKVKFENKKDIKLLKKMIKQILVCLLINVVFYLVVNNNYIFSQDFTNKAKEILAQDINFVQTYEVIKNKANEFWSKINFVVSKDNEEKNSEKTKDSKNTESSENPLPPISIRIQRIMLFLVPSLPFILLADPLNLILISTCLSVRMPSISGRTALKALPIWISISSEKPGCFRSLTFLTGKSTQDNSMHLKILCIKTIPTVSMSMPKNQKKTRAKMMLMIPSHI